MQGRTQVASRVERLDGSSVVVRNVNAGLTVKTVERLDILVVVNGPTRLVDGLSISVINGCVVVDNDTSITAGVQRLRPSFMTRLCRLFGRSSVSVVTNSVTVNGNNNRVAGPHSSNNVFDNGGTLAGSVSMQISGSRSGLRIKIEVPYGVSARAINVSGCSMS